MTTKYLLPILFVSVSALGCGEKKEKAAPTDPAPAAETTTPKVVAEPTAVAEPEPVKEEKTDLPTTADFEGEAIEKITDATLEQDLAAIEKELGN